MFILTIHEIKFYKHPLPMVLILNPKINKQPYVINQNNEIYLH